MRLEAFNKQSEDPDLWSDPNAARRVLRARTHLDSQLQGFFELQSALSDARDLIELGELEGDEEVVQAAEADLSALKDTASRRELESLLSGEADSNDCYLSINAGAGGTEACDWAAMLSRLAAGRVRRAIRCRCSTSMMAKRRASSPRPFRSVA